MKTRTTEILADTRAHSACRGCGAPIVFAEIVTTRRRMPFNHPLVALRTRHDEARRLVEEVDLGESHFAHCTQAASFRRPR